MPWSKEQRQEYQYNYWRNVRKPLIAASRVVGFGDNSISGMREAIQAEQLAGIEEGGEYFYNSEVFSGTRGDVENFISEKPRQSGADARANYTTLQAEGWSREKILLVFPNLCKVITGYWPEEESANVV